MQSELTPRPVSPAISLEAEFRAVVRKGRSRYGQKKSWAEYLIDFLTGRTELSIRQRQARDGSTQWIAYDPKTDRRYLFDSEKAIRVWIEQRHLSDHCSNGSWFAGQ